MVNNFGYLFACLAVTSVAAQNSTDNVTSLEWLNSFLMVPSVEMTNEMLAANGETVNLDPEQVAQASCVDERGNPGVCVLHYQCRPDSRSLIKDGATILDVRENVCPNVLEVCCMNVKDTVKENTQSSAVSAKCNLLSLILVLLFYLAAFRSFEERELRN